MPKTYTVVVEQGQDGYLLSSIVELPGCRTQAKTHDKLMQRTREAIKLYVAAKKQRTNTKFLGLQQIEV